MAWGVGVMAPLKHIVAAKASLNCNNTALTAFFPLRLYGCMDDDDSNGGPNFLRAWREHRGLSQIELAEKVDSSHQVIGYLERGRTQLSAKWLRKLAEALDTTPGHLLEHDPKDVPADVLDIWSHIAERDRAQAVRVLQSFTRTGTDD